MCCFIISGLSIKNSDLKNNQFDVEPLQEQDSVEDGPVALQKLHPVEDEPVGLQKLHPVEDEPEGLQKLHPIEDEPVEKLAKKEEPPSPDPLTYQHEKELVAKGCK